MLDIEKFVSGVHEYIERACSPIVARIKAIEARFDALPTPTNGKDADPATVALAAEAAVTKAMQAVALPRDGKDADPEFVRQQVALALEALPKPKDGEPGKSVDLVALAGEITAAAAKAVDALPKPKDGRDYDPEVLDAAVQRAVAALPKAENGKDADVAAITAEVLAKVTKAFDAIEVPKDGKDADPALVASMVDDAVRKAVAALPRPRDGENGKDADPEVILSAVREAVAAIPKPRDGKDFDPQLMSDAVAAEVGRRIALDMAALPKPQDGKSVTIDDIRPTLETALARWELEAERRNGDVIQRSLDRIPPPKEAPDVGAILDDLILRFTRAAHAG